jgi:ABC-type branched-subunit amino acid transport system substrate-binding protein
MKVNKVLLGFLLLLMVSSMLIIGACSSQQPAAAKTLKIGVVTSMSGDLSAALKGLSDAVKPTQDLYNNKGGITVGGQKYNLQLIAYDDQSTAAGAVTAANKLVQDQVKFAITPVYPPALRAMIPITNDAKIVAFSATQVDPSTFTSQYKYAFNCDATEFHMYATHAYLQQQYPNTKKVALIQPVDPGVDYIVGLIKKDLPAKGIQIVAQESFTPDTQDFYPILTKVLATQPDAIELPGGIPPWTAGILNAARDQGFKGPVFAAAIVGGLRDISGLLKPGYSGFFEGAPDVESSKMPQDVQDLNKLIQQQQNHPMTFDNFQVIGGLAVCLQAIQKANSIDPDKVVAAAEGMAFDCPLGGKGKFMNVDGFIHLGVMDKVAIGTIQDGKVDMTYVANSMYK